MPHDAVLFRSVAASNLARSDSHYAMSYPPRPFEICHLGAGRLYVMPKPVGGVYLVDSMVHLAGLGISSVVSLLEHTEITLLNLMNEETACSQNKLAFRHIPIRNYSVPDDLTQFVAELEDVYQHIVAGRDTVIHCYGGMGRSGLFAGSLLVRHGRTADDAFSFVSRARGTTIPETREQYQWVLKHAEEIRAGSDRACD